MQRASAPKKEGADALVQLKEEIEGLREVDLAVDSVAVLVNAMSSIGDEVDHLAGAQLYLVTVLGELNRRLDAHRSAIRDLSARIKKLEQCSEEVASVH